MYSLQLDSWKWTEHTSEVEGDHPVPRSGHAAVALPDGRHLALFGGGDADKDLFFANVAILDTLTWRWSTPKLQVGVMSLCAAHHGWSACRTCRIFSHVVQEEESTLPGV